MGGSGSGRPASGKRSTERLTLDEKIERNRVRARERWQRLRNEKEAGVDLSGYDKYKLHYKVKYHTDEERLGYLREDGKGFKVNEDPKQWMKYIREKNRQRLDDILNDSEAMERIFSDRDDISQLQKSAQRQKKYLTSKEIAEKERKLNEEFNLIEDRRPNQSTYKKTNNEQD
jgi:hypothetical protein